MFKRLGTARDLDHLLMGQPNPTSLPLRFETKMQFLNRILVSCQNEVEHAANVVLDHMIWREKNNVDEIATKSLCELLQLETNEQVREFVHCFPIIDRGEDKDGKRVLYFLASQLDIKRARQMCTMDVIFQYLIWTRERSFAMLQQTASFPSTPPYYISVLDCRNVRMSMATNADFQQFLKQIAEVDGQYAGRIGRMLIINVPFFFQMVWGVAKNWFGHEVEKKIIICSSSTQKQALLDAVGGDENKIPVDYGGTAPAMPTSKVFCNIVHFNYQHRLDQAIAVEIKPVIVPVVSNVPIIPPAPPPPPPSTKTTRVSAGQMLLKQLREEYASATTIQAKHEFKAKLAACIIKLERDSKQFEADMLLVRARQRREDSNDPRARSDSIVYRTEREVQQALDQLHQEREAWERAMAFAKNYIEVQNQEWTQTQRVLRARMDRVMDENRGLCKMMTQNSLQ